MLVAKDKTFIEGVLSKGTPNITSDKWGNTRWLYSLGKGYIALDENDDLFIMRPGRKGEVKFDLDDALNHNLLYDITNKLVSFRKSSPVVSVLSPAKFVARARARKAAKKLRSYGKKVSVPKSLMIRNNPITKNQKILLLVLVVGALTIPIFRSGMRDNLTFWQFLINHTIFGPPVEYVPSELYMEELS